jgi:hypothetical protein
MIEVREDAASYDPKSPMVLCEAGRKTKVPGSGQAIRWLGLLTGSVLGCRQKICAHGTHYGLAVE